MTETKRATFDLKPKTLLLILTVILGGGGGGFAALDFCTESDVKQYITQAKTIEDERHVVIDKKFEKQDTNIQKLGKNIQSVQEIQVREIARKEARRVTAALKNRNNRENMYDRLFVRNLKRLKEGKDPCVNLSCN